MSNGTNGANRFALVLASVITLVWAVSFVADLILQDKYDPSPFLHIALMSVAGWAFGPSALGKLRGDNGNGGGK